MPDKFIPYTGASIIRIGTVCYQLAEILSGPTNATAADETFEVCEECVAKLTFKTTWNTTQPGVSDADSIRLPLRADGTYNFVVNWGDDTEETIISAASPVEHTYTASGVYEVEITGVLQGWQFDAAGDCEKLISIDTWGCCMITHPATFAGCTSLLIFAVDSPYITSADLTDMFAGCTSLTDIPSLPSWDISFVTNLDGFLQGATIATATYSQALINWAGQTLQEDVTLDAGNTEYSVTAQTARSYLLAAIPTGAGWTAITDGGLE
jgi:surface protein